MTRKLFFLGLTWCALSSSFSTKAQSDDTLEVNEEELMAAYYAYADSVEATLQYQEGEISLLNGEATLRVPKGFKFLDENDAHKVLEELWGNPPSETLGMLVPAESGVMGDNSYAYNIFWEELGYVEDDDAEDIDYDALLEEMKADAIAENALRREQGYSGYEVIGWASEPFYDSNRKVLHWAKELHFDEEEVNTLNYNVRVLGRAGVMTLNAIGTSDQLALIQTDIDNVLSSVEFKEGSRYADFDSSVDNVAAYTIGGLVAGKVLAKAGLFAIILKFGKFILLGLLGAWAAFRKFFSGRKESNQEIGNYNKEG